MIGVKYDLLSWQNVLQLLRHRFPVLLLVLSLDRVFCFPACQLIHLNWQVLSVNLAGEYNVIVSLLSLYENYMLMLRYSFITESKAKAKQSRLNQTHIRLERALFIRTKYTMPMFGVIHFLMLQNNTYTAVFCLFLFFVFCQAHHCGALIQKHSSIVTVFLSLTHSHIFVWFFFSHVHPALCLSSLVTMCTNFFF